MKTVGRLCSAARSSFVRTGAAGVVASMAMGALMSSRLLQRPLVEGSNSSLFPFIPY